MGNLEGCKQLCEDVCTQADKFNSANYNALAGKAKSVKSGAYKQEKDFSKAEETLETGTELLEAIVPGEETAINRTCVAALFSEKASVTGITESEKKKMKKAMKDAPVHYRHQLDQNLNRNARSPRRCLIRSMFYYLHSSRVKATDLQIPVSDKRLKKVESFAQQFRRDFLGDCPMRDKALFYSALGDLFAWKGQYEEGISVVSEALRIAQDLQLNEDVIGVQDRLRQLYLLRQRGEENGRMPLEIPEGRMGRNEPFQEPRDEILQGYLEQLTRVSRSRS